MYIVFQIIFTIINSGKFSIFQAQMGLWYIQLLVVYMVALPIIERIKPGYVLVISVLLGLLVGLDKSAGHVASLSRILVFFPFFLIGYYLKKEYIEKIFKWKYFIIGGLFLLILGVVFYKYSTKLPWLLNMESGKVSYSVMKLKNMNGLIFRLIWYIGSLLTCASLMAITPKKKVFFSKFGGRTLQVFCLHIMIIILLRKTQLFVYLKQMNKVQATAIILSMGTALTFLLSLKIFSYPFDWIMKSKYNFLFRKNLEESVTNKKQQR